MNASGQLKVDLHEAFKLADKIIHNKNTAARVLGKVFFTRERRNYLFLCYAYLRSVDDFVDNKNNTIAEKKKFIADQRLLLASLRSGNHADISSVKDHFLYYIIQYAHSVDNTTLPDELLNMIRTFEWDVQRLENNGISSHGELDRYTKSQANALFGILHSFFPNKKEAAYDSKSVALASLYHFHLLGGFAEDMDLGYVNITKEEIQKYNLNENDLCDVGKLTEWVAYKVSFIEKLMRDEIVVVKGMPLKLKFLLYGLFPYVYIRIQRIKAYEYNIDNSVNKKLMREIKIYFSTFIFNITVFAKIFF